MDALGDSEQQDGRCQIHRPLHRRRGRQREGEPVGQRSSGEGQSLPGEAWVRRCLEIPAMRDRSFRRQNLGWHLFTH